MKDGGKHIEKIEQPVCGICKIFLQEGNGKVRIEARDDDAQIQHMPEKEGGQILCGKPLQGELDVEHPGIMTCIAVCLQGNVNTVDRMEQKHRQNKERRHRILRRDGIGLDDRTDIGENMRQQKFTTDEKSCPGMQAAQTERQMKHNKHLP